MAWKSDIKGEVRRAQETNEWGGKRLFSSSGWARSLKDRHTISAHRGGVLWWRDTISGLNFGTLTRRILSVKAISSLSPMRCLAVWNFSIKYLNSEKKRAKTHDASTITTTRKLPLHNKYLIKVTGNVQFFLVIKTVYTDCSGWTLGPLRVWVGFAQMNYTFVLPRKKNRAEKLTSSAMQPHSTSPSQTRLLWQMKDMKNNTEKLPRRGRESASQCKFHVTAEKVDQLSTQQPTRECIVAQHRRVRRVRS